MRFKIKLCIVCCALFVVPACALAAPLKLTVVKNDQDRRYVLAEKLVPGSQVIPFPKLTDEAGKLVNCEVEPRSDGVMVRWLQRAGPLRVNLDLQQRS